MTITIRLTVSTLKRKLKQYNLRNTIVEIIDGPGSSVGYRSASVWHFLEQKGIRVPWSKVEEIVCELHLDGVEARKTNRREYTCPGPNKAWPADGYDNKDKAVRISDKWLVGYKQESTLAVCHAFWQPTLQHSCVSSGCCSRERRMAPWIIYQLGHRKWNIMAGKQSFSKLPWVKLKLSWVNWNCRDS